MFTFRHFIGITSISFVLSACGGGSSGGGESGTQPPPPSTPTYSVTTSVTGSGSGSISPTSRTVSQGSTTTFTISPATGSTIASVGGCGGSLSGTTYTTGAIDSACTVTADFDLRTYTINATAEAGGSISPTSVSVSHGDTTSFTVIPSSGFEISSVSGCSGSLSGETFTTAPITSDCAVSASYARVLQAFGSSLTVYADEDAKGALSGSGVSGGPLSFRVQQDPSHGILTLNSETGLYGYEPDAGFVGEDFFTFVAVDGTLESEPARVEIEVVAWAGTVRIPDAYEVGFGVAPMLASRDDGGFVVAHSTASSQSGEPILDGTDIILHYYDGSGAKEAVVQVPLPDRQMGSQLISAPDGGHFLKYSTMYDLEGKQISLLERTVDPNWTIEIANGVTVAIPFSYPEFLRIGTVEIPGLRLNAGPEYLADEIKISLALDTSSVTGTAGEPGLIRQSVRVPVEYPPDGSPERVPDSLIASFDTFGGPDWWLLISYTGDGDGFLLDAQAGAAPFVLTCSGDSCVSSPESAAWTPTNFAAALKVSGVAGSEAADSLDLQGQNLMRLTADGSVSWNRSGPRELGTLYRMVSDSDGNLHVIAADPAFFGGDFHLLEYSPAGVLMSNITASAPGEPPDGCAQFAIARSLAISPSNEFIVGGHVMREFTCPEGAWGGPFIMALSPTGEVLWSVYDRLLEELGAGEQTSITERVQFVVANSTGISGFTGNIPTAVRLDSLGTLVDVRSLGLDYSFLYGASNEAGESLLPGGGIDVRVTRLSKETAVDWSLTINSTLPDETETPDRAGNALLLENGSALVLAHLPGDLPDSPRLGDRDLVVIRIAPDGTADY